MNDYQLITDATCDLNQDILDKYQISVIPMDVSFDDGRTFLHYPDYRNFAAKDFYDELRAGHTTHSAQITPAVYTDFFTPYLEAGKDILYCCFSSGLSNTYNSSVLAVRELQEKYPDRKIISVDSLAASVGEGLFAVLMAENKLAGMSIDENAAWMEANKLSIAHYFTVGDLSYLHRGGRVSAATAIVGNALNIKPVLYVNETGHLEMMSKAHGRKASLKQLLKAAEETAKDPEKYTVFIGHSDCEEEAIGLKHMVEEAIPCRDVVICRVGPVIGTHTGPELVCLFIVANARKPQK